MVRPTSFALTLLALTLPGAASSQVFFEETFDSSFGTFTAFNNAQTGNGWLWDGTCPATSLPGHSVSGTAHWINPATCLDYGLALAAGTDLVRSPRVEVPACASAVRLAFNYLIDFEEASCYDRARAEVAIDGGQPVVYADNGATDEGCVGGREAAREEGGGSNVGLDNLVVDAAWHSFEVNLPDALPGSFVEVQFAGQTVDSTSNSGEGFLVDDVTLSCVPPFYEVPTLGAVGFGAFGGLLAVAALLALARRRRAA
jgi:hypothetical protein